MDSTYTSRINIKRILEDFDPKSLGVNHVEYLENQIKRLESIALSYRVQSQNKELPPRIRACFLRGSRKSRDSSASAMPFTARIHGETISPLD